MVTIKDLANISGVSPTTVSNVLHGRINKMSVETLERVQNAIQETKYVSNMGARLLANNGSKIISVIMMYSIRNDLNVMQDPFHSEIIGALEYEIRKNGYFMMLYTSGDVEESVRMAKMWNVEGMIIIGCQPDDCYRFLISVNCPVTFIDSYFNEDNMHYVNTGVNDQNGAYQMMKYLIRQGHKKVAFMSNTPRQQLAGGDLMRFRGFKEALKEHNINFDEDNDYISFSYKPNVRKQQFITFAQGRLQEFTALFFVADIFAVDGINTLADCGVKIPNDISITGFDGNFLSGICRPMLTTVRQDNDRKAITAVNQTLDQIHKRELKQRIIRLPTMLMIRDSVKDISAE